jgi:hypothetical protein
LRNRKSRYASFGLRFRVRLPGENDNEFRKRINKAALEEGETTVAAEDSTGWVIGSDRREVGSVHCDTWIGYASDLARRGSIAVFPVGGWWKERKHLDRWGDQTRFSLMVTIDAGEVEEDIYSPVEIAIASASAIRV